MTCACIIFFLKALLLESLYHALVLPRVVVDVVGVRLCSFDFVFCFLVVCILDVLTCS
jgi:hypothetical protein